MSVHRSAKTDFLQLCTGWNLLDEVQLIIKHGGFVFGECVFASKMYVDSVNADDGKWSGITRMDICVSSENEHTARELLKKKYPIEKNAVYHIIFSDSGGSDRRVFLWIVDKGPHELDAYVLKFVVYEHAILTVHEMWYKNGHVFGTKAAKRARNTNHFEIHKNLSIKSFVGWHAVMHEVQRFTDEDVFDLKFDVDIRFWKKVLNYPDTTLAKIIKWNKLFSAKEDEKSQIPKFLIAAKPHQSSKVITSLNRTSKLITVQDLRIYAVTKWTKYDWRCPWSLKLETKKRIALLSDLPSFDRIYHANTEKIIMLGKNVIINLESFVFLNETKFEPVYLQGKLPRTCEFPVEAEDKYPLDDFVKTNCDCNLVFFTPLGPGADAAYTATCMKRQDFLKSSPRFFYECAVEDSVRSVQRDLPFVRIDFAPSKIHFVSEQNYNHIVQGDAHFFVVQYVNYKMKFSISKESLEPNANWISGDHCQAKSDKLTTFIFPVDANSVQRIMETMQPTHLLRILALSEAQEESEEEKEGREEKEKTSDEEEQEAKEEGQDIYDPDFLFTDEDEEEEKAGGEEEDESFSLLPYGLVPEEEPLRVHSAFSPQHSPPAAEQGSYSPSPAAGVDVDYHTPPRRRSTFEPITPQRQRQRTDEETSEEESSDAD